MRINLFKADEARDKAEKVLLRKRNKFIENINFIIRSASKRGNFSTDKDYEKRLGKDFLDNIKNQLTNSGYIVKDNNDGTWKIKG